MDAPVSHQSPGIIPEPAECEVETVAVERTQGSRAEPHIVIYTCRNGFVGHNGDRRAPSLVRENPYGSDLAELSAMHESHCVLPMRIAALPLAYLHDAVVFFGGTHHDVTFFDAVTQRFLAINVFTGFAGGYHLQAVPMVGCADDNDVYIFVVDQLPPVFVEVFYLLSG